MHRPAARRLGCVGPPHGSGGPAFPKVSLQDTPCGWVWRDHWFTGLTQRLRPSFPPRTSPPAGAAARVCSGPFPVAAGSDPVADSEHKGQEGSTALPGPGLSCPPALTGTPVMPSPSIPVPLRPLTTPGGRGDGSAPPRAPGRL